MTPFTVQTRSLDTNTLFTHKTISVGAKTQETPAKAIQIGKTQSDDQVADDARGFNEIYRQVDTSSLAQARQGTNTGIQDDIQDSLSRANDGELNVVALSYEEGHLFDVDNLAFMIDLLDNTSDFLAIPLMPDLVNAVDTENGTDDEYYHILRRNIEIILDTIDERETTKPVMGMIPQLPWDYIRDLIDIYFERGVRAFIFDFNGRKVTAAHQITNMMSPVVNEIGTRGLHDDVFLYTINAGRGQVRGRDLQPAEDFFSLGMGFDVLGDNHISPFDHLPPDVIEDIVGGDEGEEDTEEPVPIRTFDKTEYGYREMSLGTLVDQFPADSGLDPERIKDRTQANPQARSRLRKLLNGEQMALAANRLRTAIDDQDVVEFIQPKKGVSEDMISTFTDIRDDFDDGASQTGLSEF